MNGNEHKSFLKLIGLNEDSVNQAVEKTPAKEESWTAYLPNEGAESHSLESTEIHHRETAKAAEENQHWGALPGEEDWPIEDAQQASEESLEEHSLTQTVTEEDLYKLQQSTAKQLLDTLEPQEQTKTEKDSSQILTLSPSMRASHIKTTQTKATVPFERWDENRENLEDPALQQVTGTAHFDYSAQQADHRLVVLGGKVNAAAFHLGNLPLRMGRDPSNEVILDDVNSSRFHAEIREQNGEIVVVDLGSTNGLKVNGEIVSQKSLSGHDVIQIGDCIFEYLLPGVLSQGRPQSAAMAEASALTPALPQSNNSRRRRILPWAAALFVAIGGASFFLLTNSEQAMDQVQEIAAQRVESELITLRSKLESESGKKIDELDAAALKTIALQRLKSSDLATIAPKEIFDQIEKFPPESMKIFLQNPELAAKIIRKGANTNAAIIVLSEEFNARMAAQDLAGALKYSEMMTSVAPDNQNLLTARDRLRALISSQASSASTGYTADEQKFFEYMEEHENFVIKLIDEKKYDDALKFSEVVAKNLNDLIAAEKAYEKVGKETQLRWEERIASLRTKAVARVEKKKVDDESKAKADQLYEDIKTALNFADVAGARKMIEEFKVEYPQDPRAAEVVQLNAQVQSMVARTFEASKQKIDLLLSTEAFESAWKELYRFLEMMPDHPGAGALKEDLVSKTGARATQYYNQARVYEFEADDLVAAEQYYKRTLEVVDPRSELHEKASRRYAEMKRRSVQ